MGPWYPRPSPLMTNEYWDAGAAVTLVRMKDRHVALTAWSAVTYPPSFVTCYIFLCISILTFLPPRIIHYRSCLRQVFRTALRRVRTSSQFYPVVTYFQHKLDTARRRCLLVPALCACDSRQGTLALHTYGMRICLRQTHI